MDHMKSPGLSVRKDNELSKIFFKEICAKSEFDSECHSLTLVLSGKDNLHAP